MIKAVLFDLYRTLIDIRTDEHDPFVYSTLSCFLSYLRVKIDPEALEAVYFEEVKRTLDQSPETHPEIDVFRIFEGIMERYGRGRYSADTVRDTAMLYRSLTMRQFGLFPRVPDVLSQLRESYRIGLVTDAQWVYAEPEMAMLDLPRFFDVVVISSRTGFKKPDRRMFTNAMDTMQVSPEDSVYVGDNPDRDLRGAKAAGMRCILFNGEHKSYDGLWPDAVFGEYGELGEIVRSMS
jgi:putative hydrolase of the HAD superfamily